MIEGIADKQSLLVFNQTTPEFDRSNLSLMQVSEKNRRQLGPIRLTTKKEFTQEAVLLPAAADGLTRILQMEVLNGSYYLKLIKASDDGVLNGEPELIHTSSRPISFPTMAYDTGNTKLLILWCEDFDDGTVRLLARAKDIE